MSAASLGGISAASTTSQNRFAELSSQDFVRIMVEELANQDPFEPNDSAAIIDQLSGLQNIESQNELQDSLEALVTQNSFASATSLIGKTVTGVANDGQVVTGRVASVTNRDGKSIFTLDTGQEIPDDRLQGIQDPGGIDEALIPSLLLDLVALNGAALVGQRVGGTDAEGNDFSGTVDAVLLQEGGLMLKVDVGGGATKEVPATLVTRYG
ncbi:flagellar hook assembly protein FlgD [Mucisphaera sp.]|uniref:flagellar hook assembly protein FlgD n=1 Tax=Mucisphaera sp. TaxID=2913024 RepID=UPI003D116F66